MASLNQCNFIGNLGNEPEMKYTASGAAICNISIACSESWKDKQSGETKSKTEWVRITFFGRLAEVAGEFLHKGSQVFVSGQMQTDKYDKNGVDTYSTKIIGREMKMLGAKGESKPEQSGADGFRNQESVATNNKHQEPEQKTMGDFDDDDIPF